MKQRLGIILGGHQIMVFPQQRLISNKDTKGFQFGNFRYIFKQTPLTLFGDDGYINEIHISTCDNRPVTRLTFNTNYALDLFKLFTNTIQTRDSFDLSMPISHSNEVSRMYGCYDFVNRNFIIEVEKEESYRGNKSIIRLIMDEDDFREFVFLFYFHFLIAIIG